MKHHFSKEEIARHLSSLVNCRCRFEYVFHPDRKWPFDFAFPCCKLAIEIEGGSHAQGRHTRGVGFKKDMEKYNAATILGWRLLRFTPQELENSKFTILVEDYFGMFPCPHTPLFLDS